MREAPARTGHPAWPAGTIGFAAVWVVRVAFPAEAIPRARCAIQLVRPEGEWHSSLACSEWVGKPGNRSPGALNHSFRLPPLHSWQRKRSSEVRWIAATKRP